MDEQDKAPEQGPDDAPTTRQDEHGDTRTDLGAQAAAPAGRGRLAGLRERMTAGGGLGGRALAGAALGVALVAGVGGFAVGASTGEDGGRGHGAHAGEGRHHEGAPGDGRHRERPGDAVPPTPPTPEPSATAEDDAS